MWFIWKIFFNGCYYYVFGKDISKIIFVLVCCLNKECLGIILKFVFVISCIFEDIYVLNEYISI